MNAESGVLRSTGITSSDMRAIWPGALVTAYLAATTALLAARGVADRALWLHLLLLGVTAGSLLRGTPGWVRGWLPLALLFLLYSELPALIEAAGHRQSLDALVIGWEQAIFGLQPAQRWAVAMPWRALSEPLHLAYLSYYAIIYSVPAILWFTGRRDDFHEAVFALLLTFVACFACYIAFPVAGPRYLWPSNAPDGPMRGLAVWLLESGSSRGTAFPSSHVAVAVAQSVLAARFFGRRAWIIALPTAGLAGGAVYGGFHYAVDVIAGAALGALAAWLGLRVAGRAGAQPNASAPT